MTKTTPILEDIVEGVPAIARALYGETDAKKERRVRHLIDIAAIPTFKIGGRIAARRSLLAARVDALVQSAGK
jgi:hypothetical protein